MAAGGASNSTADDKARRRYRRRRCGAQQIRAPQVSLAAVPAQAQLLLAPLRRAAAAAPAPQFCACVLGGWRLEGP